MNEEKNQTIRCQAEDCIYNDHRNHCTAAEISVGCQNAKCCDETECETFRCENNCGCQG